MLTLLGGMSIAHITRWREAKCSHYGMAEGRVLTLLDGERSNTHITRWRNVEWSLH